MNAAGEQGECFPTRKEAQAARDALRVEVTEQTSCVTDGVGCRRRAGLAHPHAQPRRIGEPVDLADASLRRAFSELSLGANDLPCGLPTDAAAQAAIDGCGCGR